MLSTEEVKHIALLARIGLSEEDVEKYRRELSSVLDFFRELEELETKEVESSGRMAGITNVSREDRAEDFENGKKEIIRRNFPDAKDGFLKVKSVF